MPSEPPDLLPRACEDKSDALLGHGGSPTVAEHDKVNGREVARLEPKALPSDTLDTIAIDGSARAAFGDGKSQAGLTTGGTATHEHEEDRSAKPP